MNQRRRDEQEARNAAEVMAGIEHLAVHQQYVMRFESEGSLSGDVRCFAGCSG
jgi:hypothetical protein